MLACQPGPWPPGPPPPGLCWLNAPGPRSAADQRQELPPQPGRCRCTCSRTARTSTGRGACRSPGSTCSISAGTIGTPVFVYDEEHIRRRCREAVGAWGGGVAYASKAFLCRAMARLVHEEGMAIDVSTGGELHVALAAGVPGSRLVLHGNNKSDAELARALEVGVGRIVVDSFDEIDRLERLAGARQLAPRSAHPGHARHRGPYPRVRHDRPGRFEVRLRAGVGRGRGGRGPARPRRTLRSRWSAFTSISARRSSPSIPSRRRWPPWRGSFCRWDSTSCASAAVSARRT